jgi:hypothetical protein
MSSSGEGSANRKRIEWGRGGTLNANRNKMVGRGRGRGGEGGHRYMCICWFKDDDSMQATRGENVQDAFDETCTCICAVLIS